MEDDSNVIVIVVTFRSTINAEAKQNAQNLYHLSPDSIRTLVMDLSATLRRVRSRTTPFDKEAIIRAIQEEFHGSHLSLANLISTFTEKRLNTLPEQTK